MSSAQELRAAPCFAARAHALAACAFGTSERHPLRPLFGEVLVQRPQGGVARAKLLRRRVAAPHLEGKLRERLGLGLLLLHRHQPAVKRILQI